jgi:hypothetical protein
MVTVLVLSIMVIPFGSGLVGHCSLVIGSWGVMLGSQVCWLIVQNGTMELAGTELTGIHGEKITVTYDQISVGDLRELGFTRTALDKFLSPIEMPAVEKKHSYVSESQNFRAPARFYSVQDVQRALANPVVRDFLIKSKNRRNSIDEEKGSRIKRAREAVITLKDRPLREVLRDAVDSYNDVNSVAIANGHKDPLVLNTEDRFMIQRINGIAVRHIRHTMTNYDSLWQVCRNRPGASEVQEIIAFKTAEVMKRAYPQLSQYIDRQLRERQSWEELDKADKTNR